MPPNPPHSPEPAGILDGLLTRAQIAADLGCHERTVIRREREGMPYLRVGARRLYEPAKVRAWFLSQECRPEPPKRGRPPKR